MLRYHAPTRLEIDQTEEDEREVQRSQGTAVRGSGTQFGRVYRQRLADYFFERGQVPFQWNETFRTE